MRRYRSHKVVEAAVIAEVQPGRVRVGHEWIDVPTDIFARDGQPIIGVDYLVRYADGYVSWSPRAAFEEGYAEVKP
jgi:hypothetical protein